MNKLLAGALLIILIVAVVFVAWPTARIHVVPVVSSPGDEGVLCTMDAKMCPDGSSVGRSGPKCEFAACPGGTTSTEPVVLPTEFILAPGWPPVVTTTQDTYICAPTPPNANMATTTYEVVIYGQRYCISTQSEGAAGSTYTTYTYRTTGLDFMINATFTLQYPNCMNYDEPKQTACLTAQKQFNPDTYIHTYLFSQ